MKKSWLRRYTKYTLVSINIAIAFAFLLGCLLPWLSPEYFWFIGFIGFAMPYLFLALFLSIVFWLFVKRKIALYFFIVLCCGYKQASVIFAFNTNNTFKKNKANYNIRIVSWNIGNMSGGPQNKLDKKHSISEIINSLLKQNADILCLQEFEDCKKGCQSVELIKKKYPYNYFPGWIIGPHRHGSGSVIFSKYPIINGDSTRFENGENIITADIVINEDTLSFFTTHLDSYKFSRDEFKEIDAATDKDAIPKKNYRSIISKLKNTMITHSKQADVVESFLATSKYPSVFCADLNEVANNNIYWRLIKQRQDAFLLKGFGFGKTFNSLSPILRIDYIMPDNNFYVNQFDIVEEGFSDHSLLITDLVLKKYQPNKN